MEAVKTFTHNGCKVEIFQDDEATNPRKEFDHVGIFLYHHSRYELGDRQVSREEIEEISNNPDNICLPVYLLDHSGLRVSTGSFGCPWDSGQVGIIYISRETARDSWSDLTDEVAIKCLKAEIEELDHYLQGEVYGFVVTAADGEELGSCWGFYGLEGVENEAKSMCQLFTSMCQLFTPVIGSIAGCEGVGTSKCK